MDFKDIPAEYAPYVGIGLTLGIMILVVFTGYLKFGLNKLSSRTDVSSHRVHQLEAKIAALEAKEARQEKVLEEKDIAWQARMEQALEERDAQNAIHTKAAIAQRKAMETENAVLQESMENMNKQLQTIYQKLEEQATQIKAFKKTITDKDEKERIQGDVIKGLQDLVSELQRQNDAVRERNAGIIEMARAIKMGIEEKEDEITNGT